MRWLGLALRLVAAGILFQTLFFKFSGAPESKWIFGTLGVEPWGRWFAGLSELVACLLLLVPRTRVLGAGMAIGVMAGAILSHFFVLGISVQNDGGLLFGLAWLVLLSSAGVLAIYRSEVATWLTTFRTLVGGKR